MKQKAKLYGPVLLAALLCLLVFATGALKKPQIMENITSDYMVFQKTNAHYALADGDEYGVIPMGRRGWLHLSAGEYRLRWTVTCDGDNLLRLTNTNGATITPSEFVIPANAGDGEFTFTIEEDSEDVKLEFEFASGTYMDIYQVKLYTPDYQDDAFTLLFFAIGASILWLAIGMGKLTRENAGPVIFIALAVLIGSAPALKSTFVIGHDGTYHMARLLNLADGLKNGQFPVRMGGFSYDGYGAVTSVFYPDTFLYPFALMLLGGGKCSVCLQRAFRRAEHRRGAGHVCRSEAAVCKALGGGGGVGALHACELPHRQRLYAHSARRGAGDDLPAAVPCEPV